MIYHEYQASEMLSPYIKCYWVLQHEDSESAKRRERIFPDACTEMIFHFGDLFRKYTSETNSELQPRCFIHGQLKKYMEVESSGRVGIFSVRFKPAGLSRFINRDISTFNDKVVPLKDLWGTDAIVFEQKILEAENHHQRIKWTEEFLISKFCGDLTLHKLLADCVEKVVQSKGNIGISNLSREFNISKRQLERLFVSGVGLSPKFMSRIIRFNHVLQLIENNTGGNFTSVAFDGGFYDQAHFIKDFRELTGLNPKQYFAENPILVKFFNLA